MPTTVDLGHYMCRPTMPLPDELIRAIGGTVTSRPAWTWSQLTDAERDKLLEMFPLIPALPQVAIAIFKTPNFEFTAVAGSIATARAAVVDAWKRLVPVT
jgi:hypothetical protein